MIETGMLTWEQLARVMSTAPAAIGRLDGYADPLSEGSAANVTLIDPAARRTWSTGDLRGRSTNTPYAGVDLAGAIVATVHGGVATVLDGELRPADEVASAAARRREGARG